MLTRRQIRVKVLQTIYAMGKNASDNLAKEEKFLNYSMEQVEDLYLLLLSTLAEIRTKEIDYLDKAKKKHLANAEDLNPNLKFVNNALLKSLSESTVLTSALERKHINNWSVNDDVVLLLLAEVKKSDLYVEYMKNRKNSFEEDKEFLVKLFTEIIAPSEVLYDYLEDARLTWIDDIPLVNTVIQRQLKTYKEDQPFGLLPLYKDIEDKDFAIDLFRKTVLNADKLAKEYENRTPNWDKDRISEIDTIMLKMAICEITRFSSIPVKVTINEYLEIAKEYATPKSSIFINGVLDNLVKEFTENNQLNKVGRGLM